MSKARTAGADDRIGTGDVFEVVANLAAKSLVSTDISSDVTYHRLLATTRAYALEKLNQSGERERRAPARRILPGSVRALIDRGSSCIHQSQTTRPLTRPVQRRGSPRRRCAGRCLRTDRRLFRRLQIADPRLIELRAWSRLAEELRKERVRLSNRVRLQLWRYYPQMQKLTNDLAAP
jgi:hypothetical protein